MYKKRENKLARTTTHKILFRKIYAYIHGKRKPKNTPKKKKKKKPLMIIGIRITHKLSQNQ